MKRYFILSWFLIFTMLNAASIKLEIEPHTSEVGLDESFQIKAKLFSDGRTVSEIDIPGINKFDIISKSTSRNISMVNGAFSAEIIYTYRVKARKEGEYTLGPVGLDGLTSNRLKVKVSRESTFSTVENTKQKPFLKLFTNKKRIVLGEPISLKAKFYFRNEIAGNLSFSTPDFSGFVVKESGDFTRGREIVDSIGFNYIEKSFLLTPVTAGKKKIQPLQAVYTEFITNRQSEDFFSGFFGRHYEKRSITSNGLEINVDEAPNHKIDAVGDFKKFIINVDSTKANVNEPIKLTVELEGVGNFDYIETPKLVLSDNFKYYESKSFLNEVTADGLSGKKTFEYVLQANKSGSLVIPSQKFVYFDVNSKNVKTLTTAQVDLNIFGEDKPASVEKEKSAKKQLVKKDINFIEEEGRLFTEDSKLNIWVFLFLVILPIILFVSRSLGFIWVFIRKKFQFVFNQDKAFIKAKNKLKILERDGKVEKLYLFLLGFFADMFEISDTIIGEDWIRKTLLKRDWSFENIEEFLDYFHRIAGITFASYQDKTVDKKQLFSDMKKWIELINLKRIQ